MERDFHELLCRSGLTLEHAADWLDLDPRTLRRYFDKGAPMAVQRALAMLAGTFPGWEGYSIRGTRMHAPTGETVHREQIANLSWLIDNARAAGLHDGISRAEPTQLLLRIG